MGNTKQNKIHPKKDGTVKGSNGQATDHFNPVNPAQFTEIQGKTFRALVDVNGSFYSMYKLNEEITQKVVNALITELIILSNNPNPITALKTKPLQAVWGAFFESYECKAQKTDTNTKNPSQSFRNMLACFPSKLKDIMRELNTQGLPNCWTLSKSNKQPELNDEQIKFIDKFLQSQGVYNASMDLSSRFKIFKTLRGKLPETKFVTPNLGESLDHPSRL